MQLEVVTLSVLKGKSEFKRKRRNNEHLFLFVLVTAVRREASFIIKCTRTRTELEKKESSTHSKNISLL
jgi:hypothetical protein